MGTGSDLSNILVTSVRLDTSVRETILNVSVAVRESTQSGSDVYFSAQYLSEMIYLKKNTLDRLTGRVVSSRGSDVKACLLLFYSQSQFTKVAVRITTAMLLRKTTYSRAKHF